MSKKIDGKVFLTSTELGYHNVSVYLENGKDGSFSMLPYDDECMAIYLGVHTHNPSTLVHLYLHEILELAFTINKLRYKASCEVVDSHEMYLFNFTHPQFSSAVCDATEDIIRIVKLLEEKWNEYNG